jgi:hypothetical protein
MSKRCRICGGRMPLWGCDRSGAPVCYDCERERAAPAADWRELRDDRERARLGLPTLDGSRRMFDALDRASAARSR